MPRISSGRAPFPAAPFGGAAAAESESASGAPDKGFPAGGFPAGAPEWGLGGLSMFCGYSMSPRADSSEKSMLDHTFWTSSRSSKASRSFMAVFSSFPSSSRLEEGTKVISAVE